MFSDDFTGPVNLGNPDEFKISELADLVLNLTNSKSKIVQRPLPDDDPTRRRPDIRLASERLDWQPTTGLQEGLEKTIEWFAPLIWLIFARQLPIIEMNLRPGLVFQWERVSSQARRFSHEAGRRLRILKRVTPFSQRSRVANPQGLLQDKIQ